MTFVIIGCFCSVIFIPLGIALMWFYSDWKKKTKFILSFSTGFLYLFLILLLLVRPSINFGGMNLPFNYNKGYSQTSSEKNKKEWNQNSGKNKKKDGTSLELTEEKQINVTKSNKFVKALPPMILFILFLLFIILYNSKKKKSSKYKNPYVDVSLYKLPLSENPTFPTVRYSKIELENDEKILFATPTFEAGKKGDAIITTKKLVLINQQETLDFPLEMLESAISVSNTAVQIQSGSRTYYVFLNENEVKYFLSILRWICKRK